MWQNNDFAYYCGFNDVTSGDVYFDGKRINDVPANKRQVNTVFQDYALFPHMNVFDNVAFGLKIKNYPKQKLKKSERGITFGSITRLRNT